MCLAWPHLSRLKAAAFGVAVDTQTWFLRNKKKQTLTFKANQLSYIESETRRNSYLMFMTEEKMFLFDVILCWFLLRGWVEVLVLQWATRIVFLLIFNRWDKRSWLAIISFLLWQIGDKVCASLPLGEKKRKKKKVGCRSSVLALCLCCCCNILGWTVQINCRDALVTIIIVIIMVYISVF